MFKNAEFIISAVSKEQYPNKRNLDEFVFIGRSNVGKSSFINALTNRKNLAKTSSKPGKTITINFFLIDDSFYLVDVPGYGYAQRSLQQREQFGEFINEYLMTSSNLNKVFLLVDSRHKPTEDDILMYEYLKYLNLDTVIVGTKVDKVGKTKRHASKKLIEQTLKTDSNTPVILTSSQDKTGFNELYKHIAK